MGTLGFTGVPRFTVNGEIPEKNIVNSNLVSVDSQVRPRPPK